MRLGFVSEQLPGKQSVSRIFSGKNNHMAKAGDITVKVNYEIANKPTKRVVFTNDAKFAVSDPKSGKLTLSGYAIVWDALSNDRGGYQVRLRVDANALQHGRGDVGRSDRPRRHLRPLPVGRADELAPLHACAGE